MNNSSVTIDLQKLEKLLNEKRSLEGRLKNEKFVASAPKQL